MTDRPGNIYLIGPMGSGKTTIGRRLAHKLNLQFLDCDHELEQRTGASVSLIFDIEGETGFRERETRMLEELTARRGVLLATGGGTVLGEKNRELMRQSGLVVYLKTTVEQQLRRLYRDKTRPLLQTPDRKAKLTSLARERNPIYETLADIVFPARDCGPDVTARELARIIRSHRAAHAETAPGMEAAGDRHENH